MQCSAGWLLQDMLHVGEEIKEQSLFLGPGGCLVCSSEGARLCVFVGVFHFFSLLFEIRVAEEYLLHRFIEREAASGMESNVIVQP